MKRKPESDLEANLGDSISQYFKHWAKLYNQQGILQDQICMDIYNEMITRNM